jgi:hypothetical protein
MDGDWIEVKKSKNKNAKNKNSEKENENELTEREKLLLKNHNIFCKCCQASFISYIICRTIVECGKCVCCVTD